jgi:hypothetical protein
VNYSTYSQDFTIPASANNNKILKYWFDTKNDSQQVSSIPSRIDIDGVFFKYGSLRFYLIKVTEVEKEIINFTQFNFLLL